MKCPKFVHLSALLITFSGIAHAQRSSWDLDMNYCEEDGAKLSKYLEIIEDKQIVNMGGQEISKLRQELWDKKIDIHQRMRRLYQQGKYSKACSIALRSVYRTIRTLDDNLLIYTKNKLSAGEVISDSAFSENNKLLNKHPQYKKFNPKSDLKSGDIILSRGSAFTSAAIASLGEFDTQFSHMSVVYKDRDGQFWTIEAHIEVGSVVRKLEKGHIADKNARTSFYRFNDEKLAAKAAEYIFLRVKNASETTGNVNYDFAFDQEDSENLFCSEIASHSFEEVSYGRVQLPLYRSRLQVKKPDFVKQLGIAVKSSFIPADIEVDPRFTLVGEWTDANKVDDLLRKDAILQAMYKWSDELGYVLNQASSKDSLVYRNVAWPLRRIPGVDKYFEDKLPLNMSRQLAGYFGVLEGVGKLLEKVIKTADLESIKKKGFPLTKSEKYQLLNKERLTDKKCIMPTLHRMFSPKK